MFMNRDELENKLYVAYMHANEQFRTHTSKMHDKHSDRLMHDGLAKYYETNSKQISLLINQVTDDNIEEINEKLEEIQKPRIDQTML